MGRRTGQRGAAVVELAIILPVLAMLIFGIIEFGRGYSARIQLLGAVREGARAAALGGDSTAVQNRVKAAAGALDVSLISFDIEELCNVVPPREDARIEISYPFHASIPFAFTRSIQLKATGVMRCTG